MSLVFEIKRAYEEPSVQDGYRVLVDRIWPRGIKKTALAIDEWCKALSPSPDLRLWFGHDPIKWPSFRAAYRQELLVRAGDVQSFLKRC